MAFEKTPSTVSTEKVTIGTIGVWKGDYKLIHFIGEKKSLLYNLKMDYEEQNNLFESKLKVMATTRNMKTVNKLLELTA